MSTKIKTIKGVKESGFGTVFTPELIPTSMEITRYYGGKRNGRMLQLTVSNGDGYIQLTQDQVSELARVLMDSFNDEIYPSE